VVAASGLALLGAYAWGVFGEQLSAPQSRAVGEAVGTLDAVCDESDARPSNQEILGAVGTLVRAVRENPDGRVLLDDSGNRPGAPTGPTVREILANQMTALGRCERGRSVRRELAKGVGQTSEWPAVKEGAPSW